MRRDDDGKSFSVVRAKNNMTGRNRRPSDRSGAGREKAAFDANRVTRTIGIDPQYVYRIPDVSIEMDFVS